MGLLVEEAFSSRRRVFIAVEHRESESQKYKNRVLVPFSLIGQVIYTSPNTF